MKKNHKNSTYWQNKKKTIETKTFDFSKNKKETVVSIIIVFFAPVLLYLQTLSFGFTYFDDNGIILKNITFLSNLNNTSQAFLRDAFIINISPFYRPLQTISYMVDIFLSGGNNAWMYHLTNVLLLGLISCMLFLLFRKFLIPVKLAVLSTLIYCAHPLFVSNIVWIPARGDLLLMLFSLLSFLLLIEFLQKKKNIYLFWHWAAFTVALFCKETAAFLPVLFIIYYFTFTSNNRFEKKYLINIILYAISGIFWFWLNSKAIKNFSNWNNEVGFKPILLNLQTIPESLSKFFIPVDIAIFPGFSLFKALVGLIIAFMIIVIFLKNKVRSKKEKIFCMSWFLILILPTMLYKNPLIDYLHHRFFLPHIGIMLFLLFIIPKKWYKKGDIKRPWIMAAVFIILSSITFIKSRCYSDSMTFYNSAISQNPNSAMAYNNGGIIKRDKGDFNGAIKYYTKAIELKSDYDEAYNNRGIVYSDNFQLYDKAITDYTKAIELKPYNADVYNNRGVTYSNQGLYNKAVDDCTKAIELKQNFAEAYYNRGLAYFNMGLYKNAINDYTKTILLKADDASAYNNRGVAYYNMGLYDNAINDYTKAIELKPDNAFAYNNRGVVYDAQKLYDKAVNDYTKVIELKPDYADAYNNRGITLHVQGLSYKACQDFKKAEELGFKGAKDNVIKFCK